MRFDIQRANFWKRISALLFDFIIAAIVVVGIATLMSSILNYDKYYSMVEDARNDVALKYGLSLDISQEDYESFTEEQKENYTKANEEFSQDTRVVYGYTMMVNLALIIASVSVLLSSLILEFAVPAFLKHGRTLGKKIFGLAVIRTNGVKMSGQAHFIRSMIGKCTIETLVPLYVIILMILGQLGIVGIIVLILFLGLEIFAVCYTKTRSTIHDLVSDTVVVDMESQEIFDSEEELIAFKTRLHEELVSKDSYYQ